MNPIVEALNLGKMLRGSKPSNSSVLAGAIETGRQEVAAAVAAQAKASEAYTASLLSPDPCETQARHAENVAAGIEIERRRYRLADVERKYAEATRREREADAKARSLQLQRDLAVFAEDAGERYNAACETLVGIAVEMARLRERVTEVNGDAPAGCRSPDPEWLARGASDGEAVTLRETTFSAWVFTK